MPLTDRFQLLDLKRDEGARTFEAREIATGRPVLVHLFADRRAPFNRALLAKFETLPEEEKSRVIDRGEHEGGVYIVTDRLAEYPGLREWLKAHNEDRRKTLDVAGAWEIKRAVPKPDDDRLKALFPTAPRPVLEPSAVEETAAPVLTDTGAQTLLIPALQSGPVAAPPAAPPPLPAAPPPPPLAAPEPGELTREVAPPVMRPAPPSPPPTPAPAPQANEPGEFTRQFAPPVMRPAPSSPPPTPTPAPAANEPGEFTRQFAPPVMRPAPSSPPPSPAPAAAANEPGEFTRQFAPPTVMRPSPVPSPPAQQQEPGEFTAMFASQKAAPPQNPAAQPVSQPASQPPSQPGEFTRLFQAPQRPAPAPRVPPPVAPPQNPAQQVSQPGSPPTLQPGEFTQMLQAQRPAAPPPANKDSNDFGRFFQSPLAPLPDDPQTRMAPLTPPPTPPQPKGAGEFTQIFGKGAMPSPPPPPMPAAPPPSSSNNNATQVFAAPRTASTVPLPVSGGTPLAPGEYTQMFAKPAGLTFGQAPANPQAPRAAETFAKTRNKSRLPLLLAIGAAVLLIVAVIVYFLLRPHTT